MVQPKKAPPLASLSSRFLRDERGTATVEYVFVFLGLTIGVAAALVIVGEDLLHLYRLRVAWLALPIP
jgi:Flp pilus assembly pilin Flp